MADKGTILILNGPNLNMLGTREPEIYGTLTLGEIEENCRATAADLGFEIEFRQSNSEGELVDWIQQATNVSAILINPAGYTHSSVSIRDALSQATCPVIELHLSNIFRREEFRHHSHISPVSDGMICGFGANSYMLALQAAAQLIENG